MNVLALEPYYGGSHKALLDGWSAWSRHRWTVLGLPAQKWKWRMRHGALSFADVLRQPSDRRRWDLLFVSDMLNLAELRGLAPEPVRRLPAVVYFHENQLTYPVRREDERDLHFALTNVITALSADRVWFNSAFHRDSFFEAVDRVLEKMPDQRPERVVERIRKKTSLQPPGIGRFPRRGKRPAGPMRILWAARWEFDKNPEEFFEALKLLKASGVDFRLSVVGEQFRQRPPIFDWAGEHFWDHVDRWGFQAEREEYECALLEADVVVSTAHHEFFGVSMVEAVAAGCRPLLPRRLSYPEFLEPLGPSAEEFLYDGGPEELARRLGDLAALASENDLWQGDPERARLCAGRFDWSQRAPAMDNELEEIALARQEPNLR